MSQNAVRRIRLRRGLDLAIPGAPVQRIEPAPAARSLALLGDDHRDVRCALAVKPGDRVRLGETLFMDRRRPALRFTSPGAGVVSAVLRGEMRRLVAVVIELDPEGPHDPEGREEAAVDFGAIGVDALARQGRGATTARLLESGEWVSLRCRPLGHVADPEAPPDAIFVRAMDTNPLAPDAGPILRERPDDFHFGLLALSRLGDGPVFVCARPGANLPLPAHARIRLVEFEGPHPAGLVGTHIHHLFPVGGGRRVSYVGYQDTLAIGHLFRTGRVGTERVVSLAGPRAQRPRLLRTRRGAAIEPMLRGELAPGDCRIVSGSLLSGRRAASPASFLGRYHEQVCALAETDTAAPGAWTVPGGPRKGRRVPPWRRRSSWSAALHGRRQAMLPLDGFDAVVPMRLPVGLLLRALAAGDGEASRAFGALELEEEDLALCTFLCPGKQEYGALLRQALDEIGAPA